MTLTFPQPKKFKLLCKHVNGVVFSQTFLYVIECAMKVVQINLELAAYLKL